MAKRILSALDQEVIQVSRMEAAPSTSSEILERGAPQPAALPPGVTVLFATAAADTLTGGPGETAVSYANAPPGLRVYLTGSTDSAGWSVGDVFRNIQDVVGSAFDDYISGDGHNNKLYGGAGADNLYGWGALGSTSFLFGEEGDDTLIGGVGRDVMDGGDGEDTITYLLSPNGLIISLTNTALNTGWASGDTYISIQDVISSEFDDVIYGGPTGELNQLQGQSGNDRIFGGAGYNVLIGGVGADQLNGAGTGNLIDYETARFGVRASMADPSGNTGDAAGDTYVNLYGADLAGSPFDDVLSGDGGNNNLMGDPDLNAYGGRFGNDQLFGGGGDDTLDGGLGADRHDGGPGQDMVSYTRSAIGVRASMADPGGNTGEAVGDTYFNVEGILGSAFDDVLGGDALGNILFGNQGDDVLNSGGSGAGLEDLLNGGLGADALNGGSGFDYAVYGNSTTPITASLVNPGQNTGEAAGDRYLSIEGLVGSDFADLLIGDAGDNVIQGGAGDDVIRGSGGVDFLVGGEGNDTIIAGPGTSKLLGGDGVDTFTFLAVGDSISTNQIAPTEIWDFQAGIDKLDVSAISPSSVNVVQENGFYTLQASSGAALLSVRSKTAFSLADVVSVSAPRNLVGGAGADTLIGGGAADILSGGGGDDVLQGGGGADTLTGGPGADTFLFGPGDSTAAAADTITDFETGRDRLDLVATAPRLTSMIWTGSRAVLFSQGASGSQTQINIDGLIQGSDVLLSGAGMDIVGRDGVSDTLIGSAGSDNLFGLSGDDQLSGGTGDDALFGDAGGDILAGGPGADKFSYRGVSDSNAATGYDIVTDFASTIDKIDLFFLNGLQTVALVRAGAGTFVFANTSGGQVQVGFTGAVQGTDLINPSGTSPSFGYDVIGEAGNETLVGSNGNDNLFGLAGSDVLQGGAGDDALFGDAGGDILTGGAGVDKFSYRGVSDSNATTGYDIATDFISGTDKIDLFYLNGLQTISLLKSGGGTFMFAATSGGQVQVGFTGSVQGSDLINPSGTAAAFGYDIVGEGGPDTLIGSTGNDKLFGLDGNDVLTGGAGADLLSGGAGADVFAYRALSDSPASATDRITDFQLGVDKLDLRGVHGSAADRYGIAVSGSDTLVFFDANGDGVNDMQIVLGGITGLQAGDILF